MYFTIYIGLSIVNEFSTSPVMNNLSLKSLEICDLYNYSIALLVTPHRYDIIIILTKSIDK